MASRSKYRQCRRGHEENARDQ
ncbi:hypothetical protein ACHAXM_006320 [Skeletonema potamos]